MDAISRARALVRFGVFEIDPRAGELRKRGVRLRLQRQPFEVLLALLERPGDVVTRDELRQRIWPSSTFVDFDHSLATAVNKIRIALDDSAASPRFVETLPRRGYRFLATVQTSPAAAMVDSERQQAIDSLAVLPFENAGDDPETAYLSDGISDQVIFSLSQLSTVRVMARSTVFRFRGTAVDPLVVGRDLNVGAVLTGRVSARGAGLLITTELVDVATGWQLWGHQYSRERSDLLALEGEVAAEICGALHVKLTTAQRTRLAKRYTDNPAAHWSYLKGRYYANKLTVDGLRAGIEHYQEAIRSDPRHALAHAGLAGSYNLLGFIGVSPPQEVFRHARAAAAAALELDDELAEAHAVMASVKKICEWNWAEAEREYQRALALNPQYATGHHWYADFLSAMGRKEEAVHEIELAQQLDPLSLLISVELAWNFYMARDYERAIRQSLKTLEMEGRFAAAHLILGLASEQAGQPDGALTALRAANDASGGNAATLASLGHLLASMGRGDEARALLSELASQANQRFVSPYCLALLQVGLGDTEAALAALQLAYEQHDFWLVWMAREPRFDRLRVDARFTELVADIGLAPPL